jgi:hypothetical protein
VVALPPQIAMPGASPGFIYMALLFRWNVVLARVYGGWIHHLAVKLLRQGGRFAMKASRGFAAHWQHVVATGELSGSPHLPQFARWAVVVCLFAQVTGEPGRAQLPNGVRAGLRRGAGTTGLSGFVLAALDSHLVRQPPFAS